MEEPHRPDLKVPLLTMTLVLLTMGLACLTATATWLAPAPAAERILEIDMRSTARLQRKRFAILLTDEAEAFRTADLAIADLSYLSTITRASNIFDLKLFDASGLVFWSSRWADVGSGITAPGASEALSTGDIFYSSDFVPASEITNSEIHNLDEMDIGLHYVGVSHVPVLADGEVVGAFEFRRDLTSSRDILIDRIRLFVAMLGALATFASATVAAVVRRAINRQRQINSLRRHREREALQKQVELARDVRLIGELNEWLQSSNSLSELFSMIARYLRHFLPNSEGAIYVYSNSRDVLDGGIAWNGAPLQAHIRPADCWGLRRGRYYFYGKAHVNFACAHAEPHDERNYACFPILAHGDTIGLLHLKAKADVSAETFDGEQMLARRCAEQISLAIANVRMRDELHDQSVRDPLTGLFNRRYITDTLRRMTDRGPNGEATYALISIDVDHFKKFNDTFGHDAGDTVLRMVGDVLSHAVDGDEIACRMGGEEFMLFLPGHDSDAALARAETVRDAIEKISVRYGEKTLPTVTISVGVAICPDHGIVPQHLIRAADDALYAAKDGGRNRVEIAGERPSPQPGSVAIAAE